MLLKRISTIVICFLLFSVTCVCFFSTGNSIVVSSNKEQPIYYGNKQNKVVALMFNCYENAELITKISETLLQYGFKSTFFLGGCFIDDHLDLVEYLLESGHEVGNHGYFHKDHSALSYEQNFNEIKRTHDLISSVSGIQTTLFAPPSGAYSNNTLEVCKNLGYKVIMWSKDTVDWRDKNSKTVYNRATENISGGDFVLMHPTEHTLSALKDILDYYLSKGLVAGTVSQCME